MCEIGTGDAGGRCGFGFGCKVGGAFCRLCVEGYDVVADPVDLVADAHFVCALRTGSQAGRLYLLAEGIEDYGMRSVERGKI